MLVLSTVVFFPKVFFGGVAIYIVWDFSYTLINGYLNRWED